MSNPTTMAAKRRRDPKQAGMLIVLEGVDGVGKTTLAGATAVALSGEGIEAEVLAFPGNEPGTLGSFVYDLHHAPGTSHIPPTSVQLLHVAAHVDAIENRIRPALRAGRSIILDRYWWSTWVYGLVYGVPRVALNGMLAAETEHWAAIRPDAVFLVQRNVASRFSDNTRDALVAEYEHLAASEAERVPVRRILNDRSVSAAVDDMLCGLLSNRRRLRRRGKPNDQCRPHERAQLHLSFRPQQPSSAAPYVCASVAPARSTVVYDTYWRFAAERQLVFFRRLRDQAPPWTRDPIIQEYKFTNAYRASDRVSQFLIRRVVYEGDQLPREVFFRTILFKTFNRIDTWERLERAMGHIEYRDYSYERYNRVLQQAQDRGERLYSAAYIMPSGNRAFGHARKHENHLRLIERMIDDRVPERLAEMSRMADAFQLLKSYPMIGDFLAYQYVTDLNYGNLTSFSEMDFVVPGPGARDGIRKCFTDLGGLSEPEIIRFVADRQQAEFERLGIEFLSLWGRPLQLIDCQNLFCEVDKYARLAHPEIQGISGRTRIKQRFQPHTGPIDYWYPPKWGINDRVAADREGRG